MAHCQKKWHINGTFKSFSLLIFKQLAHWHIESEKYKFVNLFFAHNKRV
jgi:hypothetical protein